jgi:NAD(P)-dependent dehydrogenase (short-subunit alcohol dehydrogenase family)
VSSGAHRFGRIDLDDLMGEKRYQPWRAYGQSKLANLLFTAELQRRLTAADLPVAAYAAHPGYASTNLQHVAPEMTGSSLGKRFADFGNSVLAQSAEMGALPTLYAAVEPGLAPGSYVGPDGFMEQRGYPRVVVPNGAARDMAMAATLWDRSEALIGLTWSDAVPA